MTGREKRVTILGNGFHPITEDKLIHLDPHYCQEMVDVNQENFSVNSFHCKSPRKLKLSKLDPCCCIGFYCQTKSDFDNFVASVQPVSGSCRRVDQTRFNKFDLLSHSIYYLFDNPLNQASQTLHQNQITRYLYSHDHVAVNIMSMKWLNPFTNQCNSSFET